MLPASRRRRSAGPPTPKGGALHLQGPQNPNLYVGFEVDLAAALEKELGRRIEFVQYDFKSLDFRLATGRLRFRHERHRGHARPRQSRPLHAALLCLHPATGGPGGRHPLRLAGSVQAPGGRGRHAGRYGGRKPVGQEGIAKKVYGNQVEPYIDFGLGRIDAVLLDLPIAVVHCAEPNPKLKFVGPAMAPGYYAIAFRKDEEPLAAQFDAALDRLASRGQLRRIYEKWRIWNDDQEQLAGRGRRRRFSPRVGPAVDVRPLFPPAACEGAVMTVALTFSACCWRWPWACRSRWSRLYGPVAAAAGGHGLRRVLPRHSRALAPVLPLLRDAGDRRQCTGLPFGLKLQPMAAAILGFGLNYAAYEAEIYRAGIASIPVGQWEAGASLGMTRLHVFRRIILPQAVRVILPADDQRPRGPVQRHQHREHHRRRGTDQAVPNPGQDRA